MATSVSQPGYFNLQGFTDLGALAVGGRIYTYTQGTTTKKNAYTEATGTTVHTYTSDGVGGEYIALNARGELAAPLYLTTGAYDITYKTAAGATVWTRVADTAGGTFLQSGTGAVSRTAQSKLRDVVSVKDFGATGDGATDDLAAILLAIAASSGRKLIFPAGTYLVSGEIAISVPCDIEGDSPFATVIKTSSATANIFKCTSGNVHVSGISFESSVTRSGGSYFNNNSQANISLTNFKMSGAYRGVTIDGGAIITIGSAGKLADIRETVATTGRGIYITGTCFSVTLNGISMDNSGTQPQAGIYIDSSADVTMNACGIIRSRVDLLIAPGSGQTVDTIWATNCFFDTATLGVQIAPTSTGNVKDIKFTSCWLASHSSDGINITGSASATISGLHLIDCECKANGGAGLGVTDGVGLRDLQVIGGTYGNNASGISFATAVTEFAILGATLGRGGGVNGNSSHGAVFNAQVSNCVIANNICIGNTSSAMTFSASPGAGVNVSSNPGFNPQGWGTISPGASPYTYTAGNTAEQVMISSGTVSLVAVNGNSVYGTTNVTVYLSAGETCTVTYSSVPGMTKYRL